MTARRTHRHRDCPRESPSGRCHDHDCSGLPSVTATRPGGADGHERSVTLTITLRDEGWTGRLLPGLDAVLQLAGAATGGAITIVEL
jgi:hypothetical protein